MEKLRFGVLSTADIGLTKVIPAMTRAERCEVVAIASRDASKAQAAAAQLGIPTAYGSYEALLGDPDVDAVYIPLPNHMHAEWTIAAARAGKHVLCEKPLGLDADEAQRMVDACAQSGVKLMEAFMYRQHPSWLAVRELIAQGRIGELRAVTSWFSYFNDDPTNIRNIAAAGGGALYDVGCYCINLSRMLFGAEPTVVQAAVRRDPVMHIDTTTSALLEFEAGLASFTCSTRLEPDQQVNIYGTRGRLSLGIPFNIPPHLPTRVFLTIGGDPPVAPGTQAIDFDPADAYAAEADAFARSVLDGEPLPVPAQDAVNNMRVIDRIFAITR